jgi:hypothetical protein
MGLRLRLPRRELKLAAHLSGNSTASFISVFTVAIPNAFILCEPTRSAKLPGQCECLNPGSTI